MKALLKKLNINQVNPGACTGPDGWIEDPNGKKLVSYNPTTDQPIATVIQATEATYQTVVSQAVEHCGGHLGIAEDLGPFAEAEVGGDDHAGALIELAQEVEQQCAA